MSGGGAIFARGGRFRVINSRFFGNTAAPTGHDDTVPDVDDDSII